MRLSRSSRRSRTSARLGEPPEISHLDSEQSLSEQIEQIDALAELVGLDPESAKAVIYERLAEFEERQYLEERPSFAPRNTHDREEFIHYPGLEAGFIAVSMSAMAPYADIQDPCPDFCF